MISDLHSIKFYAYPSEIYKMEGYIIEKEDIDFIIFLCMLLSGKIYILLTGNTYYCNYGHFSANLSTIQIANSYLYNYDEITNIDHVYFCDLIKSTGNIIKDDLDKPDNKIDNNINQQITVSFDQDKEKFIIQTN
jgi:hypothetical protein